MDDQEVLSNITADIVSERVYSDFLSQLFACAVGNWRRVDQLSVDVADLPQRLDDIDPDVLNSFRVSWLDFPNSLHGEGFCLIVFYAESIFWNNAILFNRQLFLKKEI